MRTALRKMGNSTGIILPKAILRQLGIESGATLDLRVEAGELAARPVNSDVREGWAEAADDIGSIGDVEAEDWRCMPIEADAKLKW